MQSDYEEQKLLAEQRLIELEKLTENYKGSLEEIEKHKMDALQVPESVVLQSAPYRTLQSQYSVIFNELNLVRNAIILDVCGYKYVFLLAPQTFIPLRLKKAQVGQNTKIGQRHYMANT